MAPNNRIFYAIYQMSIKPNTGGAYNQIHGLQNCGVNTNYNLIPVFEVGQSSLYANLEQLPDVQLSSSKVLDGYPLIYHRATSNATSPTLIGRSTEQCVIALSIFPDTNTSANGTPVSEVVASGMFVSSISYTFPVEGFSTEEVSFVGNSKIWARDANIALGAPAPGVAGGFTTGADSPIGNGGVVQRGSIQFTPNYGTGIASGDNNNAAADPDCTVLPREVFGINASGVNVVGSDGNYPAHIQGITCSVDLSREALNELGHMAPYTRFASFPVQVTTEVSVISISGDMVSATQNGIYSTGVGCGYYLGNLRNATIRVATCEGTRVYLGLKNKLNSINYTGGDTGGGNVTVAYSFQNYNDFTVMHSGDPNTNFSWADRASLLIN